MLLDYVFIEYFAALMDMEYKSCNYEEVLACFDQQILPYEYEILNVSDMLSTPEHFGRIKLFYLLSKLRKENDDCHEDGIFNCISMAQKYEKRLPLHDVHAASATFVSLKRYNASFLLLEKCTAIRNQHPFLSKLLLAKSYLELHRGELCQPSSTEIYHRFHEMKALFDNIQREHSNFNHVHCDYFLVLAQWYYLTHELRERQGKDKILLIASGCLKHFLGTSLRNSIFFSESKGFCSTCNQAVTPTEVQYVCSGCRVACYCSIDHQRMTWKKEAVRGMRIGHEILCPLYKAYRKIVHARDVKDKEKESRMERRLDRECLRFLEYGLGLKDKCFIMDV